MPCYSLKRDVFLVDVGVEHRVEADKPLVQGHLDGVLYGRVGQPLHQLGRPGGTGGFEGKNTKKQNVMLPDGVVDNRLDVVVDEHLSEVEHLQHGLGRVVRDARQIPFVTVTTCSGMS